MHPHLPALSPLLGLLLLGGCAIPPVKDPHDLPRNQVQSVQTEHSLALSCLGDLIDRSGRATLTVYVDDIDDATVPTRYDKRRLSHGGEWWLHNAVNKIGSPRVVSRLGRPRDDRPGNHILITGAWTQDDMAVARSDVGVDGRLEEVIGLGRMDFFLGGERSRDVIAGDFLTVRDGHVLHATAISLALDSGRHGAGLDIQDGARRFSVDASRSSSEGPQFAQRRIAEAAALVHIARAFDIDYRGCAELGWASPVSYQTLMAGYLGKSTADRHRALQQALNAAGYDAGAADGVWGQRSVAALMAFQSDRGLAVTGQPSAADYAALQVPAAGR